MNAELPLEHFDRIAEVPDAIPRLRQFILDLAVRGKLVGQNPEENGSVPRKLPNGMEEVKGGPFDIPATWQWRSVRSITENHGQKVPQAEFTYIDVGAIDNKRGVVASPQILSSDEAPSRARKVVVPGDVIYSTVRPYLLNVAIIEQNYLPEAIASTAFAVLGGIGVTVPRFLWFALRSPYFIGLVEERMRGQAYPAINDRAFGELPIPLPPLFEQHRIVAKVNELMAICDDLEARQQAREAQRDRLVMAVSQGLVDDVDDAETMAGRTQFYLGHFSDLTVRREHVGQLRQTILELAVRGKLVEQDLEDEPARVSVREIVDGGLERDDRLVPFRLPRGWSIVRMSSIASKLGAGSTPKGGKAIYQNEGVPFIRSQNVYNDGLRLSEVARISESIHQKMLGTHVEKNDILLNITGASIGRCALVPQELGEANVSQHVAIIRLIDARLREFIHLALTAPFYQAMIMNVQVGVSREGLSMKRLREFPMVIPPLAEQLRIVAKVDELMAICDEIEQQIEVQTNTAKDLLESILDHVLAG